MLSQKTIKKKYKAPSIKVLEAVLECGYAGSGFLQAIDGDRMIQEDQDMQKYERLGNGETWGTFN